MSTAHHHHNSRQGVAAGAPHSKHSTSSSSSTSASSSSMMGGHQQPPCLDRACSSGDQSGAKSAGTRPTCIDSSEEFTLSAELSTTTANTEGEEPAALQLSGLSIVDELSQETAADEHTGGKCSCTTTTNNNNNRTGSQKTLVRFVDEVTYIDDKELALARKNSNTGCKKKKKKRKSKKTSTKEKDDGGGAESDGSSGDAECAAKEQEEEQEEEEEPATPQQIWWSPEELATIEMNALYMVKECQQYQEEVVCTVLYNKAFLTAAYLAKTISEDELEERLKDIGPHTQNLESWTAVGQCRRGLENFVSEKATEHAIQSRKGVLQFQQALRASAAAAASSSASGDEQPSVIAQHADCLAHRCQESSRTARLMARMMGQADRDSLEKAEELCQEQIRLPEPPGVYDHFDYYQSSHDDDTMNGSMNGSGRSGSCRSSRKSRRASLIKPIKKAFGNVFRRQGSEEVHRKRIMKMQQKQMEEAEPARRPSQEFRRSFLDLLGYGEAPGVPRSLSEKEEQ